MTIAIAADHAGFPLKVTLRAEIEALGHEILDLGTFDDSPSDWSDHGHAVAAAVVDGRADFGIVVCGTGIGVSIAANRHPGIRAALCHDSVTARYSRQHNDANVLALGARIVGTEVAKDCVRTFLATAFEGGRHLARVAKIDAPESGRPVLKEVK